MSFLGKALFCDTRLYILFAKTEFLSSFGLPESLEIRRSVRAKKKGKFADKGKGKSKNSKSSETKGYDSKGHGKQWSDHSKGKGCGHGKGRGDGGKGNQSNIQCWHCGGNHRAANCWKSNHVRQVCDGQDTPQQQQHQQQQSIPPSQSSQSQHVSNPAAPSSVSATTYRVNRVSTYNDAQELVFDLCGSDVDFSDIRICALKTSKLSNCCVETFCIANEADSDECKSNDFPSDCSHASLEDISRLYSDDTDWVAVGSLTHGVTSAWLDGYEMVQSSYVCLRDDRTWKPQPIPVACPSPWRIRSRLRF